MWICQQTTTKDIAYQGNLLQVDLEPGLEIICRVGRLGAQFRHQVTHSGHLLLVILQTKIGAKNQREVIPLKLR